MPAIPHVSILLPARDAGSTLAACLRSVSRQTLADWECVVVDDGSTDATATIARRFARGDPRFSTVTTARRGLVPALAEGLSRCRGALIARMDADDLMHRRRLDAQCAAMEGDPTLSAVGCHVRLFPRARLTAGLRDYERWLNGIASAEQLRAEAFVECPLVHPTLMIRRRVLTEFGYRDRGWPEDYDLVLRLLGAGHRIGMVSSRHLSWRDGPDRLWRTSPAYALDRFLAVKAHFLAEGFLREGERYALWGYGHTAKGLRRALAGEGGSCPPTSWKCTRGGSDGGSTARRW
ncbi:MAG: glycosyltransferase family 2 protein [Deltaproteobacteria bacterium]|nr:glycosyltransferase family 2 protein [Deltaproteobacteria bacterium]